MRRPFLRLLAVLLVAAFGAAACDSPTAGGKPGPGKGEEAQIGFALDLSGLPVATLAVLVTASDISTPLVFNIPVVNGTASGTITVPAGLARVITVRAFDAQGTLTHEGSANVQQVNPGANVSVTITLMPRAGNVPIVIQMGSMVMTVTRLTATPPGGDRVGDSIRFSAQVTHPDGTPVAGAVVRWASTNPAIATVDAEGWVRARVVGSADIVATYNGFGATQTLTFTPRDATPPPDGTAPTLTGVSIEADSVTFADAADSANVTVAVTAYDAGVGVYSMGVVLRGPNGTTLRLCTTDAAPVPGTATRTCTVTLTATAGPGAWTVQELGVIDDAGNATTVTAAELMAAGFDHGVHATITDPTPLPDTDAPVLTRASFTPDQVNVSTGTATVTLRIEAYDEGSGIARVELFGAHESGTYAFATGTEGALKVSADTWETYLVVDGETPPTGWVYLNTLRITDNAGNVLELDAEGLTRAGSRASLYVEHGVIIEP